MRRGAPVRAISFHRFLFVYSSSSKFSKLIEYKNRNDCHHYQFHATEKKTYNVHNSCRGYSTSSAIMQQFIDDFLDRMAAVTKKKSVTSVSFSENGEKVVHHYYQSI